MIIRRVLTLAGEVRLTEVQFIGVSGQACATTYEINSPDVSVFTSRVDAEAAFNQLAIREPVDA